MGKRSDFKRVERDFYATPLAAVKPLAAYLNSRHTDMRLYQNYVEPCAGDGRLVDHIFSLTGLKASAMYDIEPMRDDIQQLDFFESNKAYKSVITNPPWDRKILHPMIEKIMSHENSRAFLLFDADWMHTVQSSKFMKYCKTVISIGRVKWIEDSKMTGKDNCAWYEFVSDGVDYTRFVGR